MGSSSYNYWISHKEESKNSVLYLNNKALKSLSSRKFTAQATRASRCLHHQSLIFSWAGWCQDLCFTILLWNLTPANGTSDSKQWCSFLSKCCYYFCQVRTWKLSLSPPLSAPFLLFHHFWNSDFIFCVVDITPQASADRWDGPVWAAAPFSKQMTHHTSSFPVGKASLPQGKRTGWGA